MNSIKIKLIGESGNKKNNESKGSYQNKLILQKPVNSNWIGEVKLKLN